MLPDVYALREQINNLILTGIITNCKLFGGHGVGRRPWDTKVLMDNVSDCYVLTDKI